MAGHPCSVRYLILGEGVRDIQWQDIALIAPYTSYTPSVFSFPRYPSSPLASVDPVIRMYGSDVAISFPSTLNMSSVSVRRLPVSSEVSAVPVNLIPAIHDATRVPAPTSTSPPPPVFASHRSSTSLMIAPPALTNPAPSITEPPVAIDAVNPTLQSSVQPQLDSVDRVNVSHGPEDHDGRVTRAAPSTGAAAIPPEAPGQSRRNSAEKKLSPSEYASQQAQNEALQSIIAKAGKRRARSHSPLPSLSPKVVQAVQRSKTSPHNETSQSPSSGNDPTVNSLNPAFSHPSNTGNKIHGDSNRSEPAQGPPAVSAVQQIKSHISTRTPPEHVDPDAHFPSAEGGKHDAMERGSEPPSSEHVAGKQRARDNAIQSGKPGSAISRGEHLQGVSEGSNKMSNPQRSDPEQNLPAVAPQSHSKPGHVDSEVRAAVSNSLSKDPQPTPVASGNNDVTVDDDEITPVVKKTPTSNSRLVQRKSGETRKEAQISPVPKVSSKVAGTGGSSDELLDEMGAFLKQFVRVVKALSESGNPKFDLRRARSRRNQENFLTKLLGNFAKLHNIESDLSISRNEKARQPRTSHDESTLASKEQSRATRKLLSRSEEPRAKKIKTGASRTAIAGDVIEKKSPGVSGRVDSARTDEPERNWNSKTQEAFDGSIKVIKSFPKRLQAWGLMMKRGMDKEDAVILAAGRVRVNLDSLQKPLTSKEVSSKELESWLIGLNDNVHIYSRLWYGIKSASESRKGKRKEEVDLCSRYLEGLVNLLVWADMVVFLAVERCKDTVAAPEFSNDAARELEGIIGSFLKGGKDRDVRSGDGLMQFLKKLPDFIDDPEFDMFDESLRDLCKTVKGKVKQVFNKVSKLSECTKSLSEKLSDLGVEEGGSANGGSGKDGGIEDSGSKVRGNRNASSGTDGGPSPTIKLSSMLGGGDLLTGGGFADDVPIPRRKPDTKKGTDRESEPSPNPSDGPSVLRKNSDGLREREKLRPDGLERRSSHNTSPRFETSRRRSSDNREFKSTNNQPEGLEKSNAISSPQRSEQVANDMTSKEKRSSVNVGDGRSGPDVVRPTGVTFKAFHPTKVSYTRSAPVSSINRANQSPSTGMPTRNSQGGANRSDPTTITSNTDQRRGVSANSPNPALNQPVVGNANANAIVNANVNENANANSNSRQVRGILRTTPLPDKPPRTGARRVTFAERPQGYASAHISSEETETLFHDGYDLLGESNPVQAALVKQRIDALSRGSVFILFAFFQHAVNVMKHQSLGMNPPDVERLRIPYPTNTRRHLERTLDINLTSPHNLGATANARTSSQVGRTTLGSGQGPTNGPTRVGIHTPITGLRSAPSPLPAMDRHATSTGLRSVPIHSMPIRSDPPPKQDRRDQ